MNIWKLGVAISWMIVIIILSTIGGPKVPGWGWIDMISPDKWAHAFVYAVLMILLLRINRAKVYSSKKWTNGLLMICISLGILMEIVQYLFFPGRYFEILDIIANIIGAFIGMRFFNRFLK